MTGVDIRELIARWDARDGRGWTSDPLGYRELARDAPAVGHPMLASEVLREALSVHPPDAELRYLAALANARIGCWREAAALVVPLLEDESIPAEIALEARSLAGRIAKDRWARTRSGPERERLGAEAVEHYRLAWEATRDPFPGINAATLTLLTGDTGEARELALAVRRRVAESGGAGGRRERQGSMT